jgi:micrococcal nuclease
MRRKLFWLKIGVVILFVGLVGWRYFYGGSGGAVKQSGGEAEITATPVPTVEAVKATGEFAVVKRVIDGDTVELESGEKVRYIGIDTPETLDPRKPVQCFGKEAAAKNRELVEGKRVRLEKDVTDRDKYSRLLRYVYVDKTFVNLELVKQGFALSYTYPPDVKYQDLLVAAEKEAREAGRGLWNSCPVPKENVGLSPTGIQVSNMDSGCKIKGNIGATGEKIYHLLGCGSYDKTKIDESRGEKWFCSEDEAVSVGWRKAKNCP